MLKLYQINKYYIFLKKLDKLHHLPLLNINNLEFFNIQNIIDLDELIRKKYKFLDSELIKDKYIEEKNANIFVYFINKELAHFNCYWIEEPYKMPILNKFKNKESVFIGPAITTKKYRGLGLYQYDFINGYNYFYKKKFNKIYGEGNFKKKEVKFFMQHSGFKIIEENRLFTLFNRFHYKLS